MNKKIVAIHAVIISCIVLHTHPSENNSSWLITEQTAFQQHRQHVAQKYWDTCVINGNNHNHVLARQILTERSMTKNDPKTIAISFDKAIQTKDFTTFCSLFNNLDSFGTSIINGGEKLSVPFCYGNFFPCKKNPIISSTDIHELIKYIKASNFSGIASIHIPHITYTAVSSNITSHDTAFSIHSITKIFTELLPLILVQEKIIPEEWLHQPLCISQSAKNSLLPSIIQHLNTVTAYNIMIHRSGLGDYTVKYFESLSRKIANQEHIMPIQELEDFLHYADDRIITLKDGETNYSNLALLLLGLSIEHCYNKNSTPGTYLSFDEILHKYIIQPANMKIFSSHIPENGCYNESGSCSQYICASPAGGHWTTTQDLHNFGAWLHTKYNLDSKFRRLVETYGQEFYSSEMLEIHHCGGIGQPDIGEACARFALFLRHGISVAIMSNRPQQAFTLYKALYYNIFADKKDN